MKDLQRGLLATLPLTPGVVAFGLLYGMMARQVGLSPLETLAMSLIVHAGSAQFAAVGMWQTADAISIILTTLILNLRHLLMGASLAPHLRAVRPLWKALLALWMSDESYALTIARYEQGAGSHLYFLGTNLGVYISWSLSGFVGALLGTAIPNPERYGLNLIFPLAFMGLLMAFVEDRVGLIVVLAAGGLALLGTLLLPGNWHVITAGLLGSSLGLLVEESQRALTHS